MDLADALLSAQGPVWSLPQLSLEPAHRRGWGSTYAALARGRIDAERLRELLAGCLPAVDPLVFAVDVTAWPRCDAECSPERGLYYHPSRHSAGGADCGRLGVFSGSHRSALTTSAGPPRSMPSGCILWMTPITLPPARSARCWGGCPPTGRCRGLCATPATTPPSSLWTWPTSVWWCWCGCGPTAAFTPTRHHAHPAPEGRPRRHGANFNCADPTTWPTPTASHTTSDDQYGTVTVHAWAGLHPKQHRHPGHGSGAPRPIVRGTILRVQVQRIPARTRPPKVLWPWWAGPEGCVLDLELAWRAYTRRFDLEHTIAFASRRLGGPPHGSERPSGPSGGPGPPGRRGSPAAVGATPTPAATVTGAAPPRVSAAAVRTGLAGQCAETRRALPRPAQGQPPRARDPVPGDQETHQQASEEAEQDRESRLTGPAVPHIPPTSADGQPDMPQGLKRKLSEC
jgi:hypothetical protein